MNFLYDNFHNFPVMLVCVVGLKKVDIRVVTSNPYFNTLPLKATPYFLNSRGREMNSTVVTYDPSPMNMYESIRCILTSLIEFSFPWL